MLLKVSEELNLGASQDEVWKLLRDTPRLAALLPGVESVTPLDEPGAEAYQAKASDKIGPFKVALNLEIRVTEAREPVSLKAGIKGSDSIGLNRITGSLHITLSPLRRLPKCVSKPISKSLASWRHLALPPSGAESPTNSLSSPAIFRRNLHPL